ncbi:isopentenyl-diphosphate Delta-isomerase [Mycobacterium sp. NPDC048908]|uniref:isopentenyl-diphosphate Delta-isomerase n=1 Tax=Mycobacterium sp. NPDC048908 TaxID=3364292 RepID=UPI00371FD3AF
MSLTSLCTDDEQVVLVDEDGRAIGAAAKAAVHHHETPLHLAFSCYVFGRDGRVLLTRRALGKRTWPGVWTNSFCGHPSPGESPAEAVHRRGRQELGLSLYSVECALPDFRYRAVAADGTVENEICPVFCARADGPVRPVPDEVIEHRWVSWNDLRSAAELPWTISPWAVQQIPLLTPSTYMDRGPSSSTSSATPTR